MVHLSISVIPPGGLLEPHNKYGESQRLSRKSEGLENEQLQCQTGREWQWHLKHLVFIIEIENGIGIIELNWYLIDD